MILTNLVRNNYDKLNKNDLKIYSFIIQNKNEFLEININDFARRLLLTSSAIMSFAKKLDLDGYSELKYLVKGDFSNDESFDEKEIDYTKNDINLTMTMMQSLNLDPLFEKLDNSDHIYTIASGYTQLNVAEELKRNFLTVDKMVYIIDTKYSEDKISESISSEDVVFVISLSGENERLIKFIRNLKKNPTVASITRLSNNSISYLSDYSIAFVTHEVFDFEQRMKISPISQFYVVIDFLILKYLSFRDKKNDI